MREPVVVVGLSEYETKDLIYGSQGNTILFQDHIRMFHEECGGIVVGPLNGEYAGLWCAECGIQMTGLR